MPQELRIGPYSVYFWSNENAPLEPIHVHISEGKATPFNRLSADTTYVGFDQRKGDLQYGHISESGKRKLSNST